MKKSVLTKKHYEAFGHYMNEHARLETILHFVIADLLGVPSGMAGTVTTDMSARQKRDAAIGLLSYHLADDTKYGPLLSLVEDSGRYSKLRDFMAHAMWKAGRKAGSVKPMIARGRGTLKVLGQHHNEKSWTVSEINTETKKMADHTDEIAYELQRIGLGKDFGKATQ